MDAKPRSFQGLRRGVHASQGYCTVLCSALGALQPSAQRCQLAFLTQVKLPLRLREVRGAGSI